MTAPVTVSAALAEMRERAKRSLLLSGVLGESAASERARDVLALLGVAEAARELVERNKVMNDPGPWGSLRVALDALTKEDVL